MTMGILSETKYFNKIKVKKKKSLINSHTFNNKNELLISVLVDDFLFLRNESTKEVNKLFPTNKLTYLDFEFISDGCFLFVIKDVDGLTCQIRDFDKGTLLTYKLDIDSYCTPCVIIKDTLSGVYFSKENKIVFKPLVNNELLEEQVLKEIPGEHLEYAVYDEENSCVKIVTKVNYHSMIHPGIINSDRLEKEFTEVPLEVIMEKKDV